MTAFGPAWLPHVPAYCDNGSSPIVALDTLTLDADEEEAQLIGYAQLAAGSGSKTFGTTNSKIGWLPGASIAFVSSATLRVGVKKAASISTTAGPPARATIGAAAFDVYKDLVGGTDTITSTTWREETMASGTPFTVNHNDLLAVCFHLDLVSGTQSIKVRQAGLNAAFIASLVQTLVTSGPTYTAVQARPNARITFDDGSLGWLYEGIIYSAATVEVIGNTNIYGNIFRPTVPMVVDAVAMEMLSAGTTNFDVGIWLASDPSAPIASVSVDPQQLALTNTRTHSFPIVATTLSPGVDYVVGVKQNSATGLTINHYSVDATTDWPANGMDANCYAVKSTGGAAFAAENSSKRRAMFWIRAHMASGLLRHPGMAGGLSG